MKSIRKQRHHAARLVPKTFNQERLLSKSDFEKMISTLGYVSASAKKLIEYMEPGDEIIEFCTDQASWEQGLGIAGFKLRRKGVDVPGIGFVYRMN